MKWGVNDPNPNLGLLWQQDEQAGESATVAALP